MTATSKLDWTAALRESGFAALAALMLTIPMVGFRTIDRPTGLGLDMRFDEVAAAALLVFFGRLGLR